MDSGRRTVLQIIPRLDTGGAELSTIEITQALTRAGARALVATDGGRLANRIVDEGGVLLPFPAGSKNPMVVWLNAQRLYAIIRREDVALVHARSRAPAWSALWATRRAGIPLVTTYHGAYGERGPLKRAYNGVMARADLVIANSQYTAGLIRSRYATPGGRIRVIHRGVDLRSLDPSVVTAGRIAVLRQAWNVSPDQPVVLQAARLTSWKGQRVLIEAIGHLQASGRLGSAVLVLAGDDQGRHAYAEGLKNLARECGIADRVCFAGHVDDMAAAFATAHVAVVASTEPEAFGRAATEAQALGCPIVATNIGAPPETVLDVAAVGADRATGWLIAPGDSRALAAAVAEALALSPEARRLIGARGRSHIATHFTLEAMHRATLGVYDELLSTDLEARYARA